MPRKKKETKAEPKPEAAQPMKEEITKEIPIEAKAKQASTPRHGMANVKGRF